MYNLAIFDITVLLLFLQVIDMVAHSSEFQNIVVREEEQNELEMLVRKLCPLEVKGGPSNKHGKISVLIQVAICSGTGTKYCLESCSNCSKGNKLTNFWLMCSAGVHI